MANIRRPKAPNLPIPTISYSQTYIESFSNALRLYFNTLDSVINLLLTPSAGPTASRPITGLQIGQQYFDTTINRPIWWTGTNWINAAGTVV
jgi:hypothetical protein